MQRIRRYGAAAATVVVAAAVAAVSASAQMLLPNGQQQFTDNNGDPLAAGKVYFYIPNTTTAKATYQNSALTVPNSNPVVLNAAGRAIVWGQGQFREVVYDQFGTLVWDQITSGLEDASGIAGGFGARITLPSSSTTNIGTASSNNVLVTGSTTISSFGTAASLNSPIFVVTFSNSLQLTYNATSMLLPGGKNMSISAGDSAILQYLGSGNWQMIQFLPARPDVLAEGFGAASSLASATTVDLGSATGNNAQISGSVAITSFGSGASVLQPVFLVKFIDGTQLTYNATSMILPGGANITTNAGDTGIFLYLGSGNWQMIQYSANGVGTVKWQNKSFTADGAFSLVLPANVTSSTMVELVCQGPGGGGGSHSGGSGGGGGGGGSGAFADFQVTGMVGGQTLSGSVGGVGGVGSSSSGAAGGNGNAVTKFTYNSTDVLVCGVGVGGASSTGGSNAGGAAGAVTTNFPLGGLTGVMVMQAGQAGGAGRYHGSDVGSGGQGGSSPLGQGAPFNLAVDSSASTGAAAAGYGGGGAGGASNGVGTQNTGGNGTPGIAIVKGVW